MMNQVYRDKIILDQGLDKEEERRVILPRMLGHKGGC